MCCVPIVILVAKSVTLCMWGVQRHFAFYTICIFFLFSHVNWLRLASLLSFFFRLWGRSGSWSCCHGRKQCSCDSGRIVCKQRWSCRIHRGGPNPTRSRWLWPALVQSTPCGVCRRGPLVGVDRPRWRPRSSCQGTACCVVCSLTGRVLHTGGHAETCQWTVRAGWGQFQRSGPRRKQSLHVAGKTFAVHVSLDFHASKNAFCLYFAFSFSKFTPQEGHQKAICRRTGRMHVTLNDSCGLPFYDQPSVLSGLSHVCLFFLWFSFFFFFLWIWLL